MRSMMTAAVVLGVVVAVLAGALLGGRTDGDAATQWEGMAAVGFLAAIVDGPFWIAQGVCTLIATLDGATWWLWAWFFAAPAVGVGIRGLLPSKA